MSSIINLITSPLNLQSHIIELEPISFENSIARDPFSIVCSFLNKHELCVLSEVSTYCNEVSSANKIWRKYCLDLFPNERVAQNISFKRKIMAFENETSIEKRTNALLFFEIEQPVDQYIYQTINHHLRTFYVNKAAVRCFGYAWIKFTDFHKLNIFFDNCINQPNQNLDLKLRQCGAAPAFPFMSEGYNLGCLAITELLKTLALVASNPLNHNRVEPFKAFSALVLMYDWYETGGEGLELKNESFFLAVFFFHHAFLAMNKETVKSTLKELNIFKYLTQFSLATSLKSQLVAGGIISTLGLYELSQAKLLAGSSKLALGSALVIDNISSQTTLIEKCQKIEAFTKDSFFALSCIGMGAFLFDCEVFDVSVLYSAAIVANTLIPKQIEAVTDCIVNYANKLFNCCYKRKNF